MKNDLTKKEIKNSVEYQWRKHSLQLLLFIWGIIAIVTFVVFFGRLIVNVGDLESMWLCFQVWLLVTLLYSVLLFLPGVAFYYYKMMYLRGHYGEWDRYEVTLDKVSVSMTHRGAAYYTVSLCDEGVTRQVRTNPCFSSGIFASFVIEDYHNKKVIGLYDRKADKLYIVKKIG